MVLDALAVKEQHGGIRTFAVGLAGALARRDDVDLTVVTSAAPAFAGLPLTIARAPRRVENFFARTAWRERHLGAVVRRASGDVVIAAVPEVAYRESEIPTITVVHDVNPLVAPAYHSKLRTLRFAMLLPRTLRQSAEVVAVSEATALSLVQLLGRTDVTVIGEGVGSGLSPEASGSAPATTSQRRYLYVGTLLAYKNVGVLIDGVAVARDHGVDVDLTLVGPSTDRELHELRAHVMRTGLEGRVRHEGYVPRARLRELYERSTALLVPTLAEGFGLPLIEALSTGRPVIASDLAVLRETAGVHATYVRQPWRPESWAEAMASAASPSDADRESAVEHAHSFEWDAVGGQYVDLIRAQLA